MGSKSLKDQSLIRQLHCNVAYASMLATVLNRKLKAFASSISYGELLHAYATLLVALSKQNFRVAELVSDVEVGVVLFRLTI